jgi:hypothetical protein
MAILVSGDTIHASDGPWVFSRPGGDECRDPRNVLKTRVFGLRMSPPSSAGDVAFVMAVHEGTTGKSTAVLIERQSSGPWQSITFPQAFIDLVDFKLPPVVVNGRGTYVNLANHGYWRVGDPPDTEFQAWDFHHNSKGDIALASHRAVEVSHYDGSTTTLCRSGDLAPGPFQTVVFGSFKEVRISDSGHVLFKASRIGPGIDESNDEGVWFWDGTMPRYVIAEGDQSSDGYPVHELNTGLFLTNDDGMAIAASLTPRVHGRAGRRTVLIGRLGGLRTLELEHQDLAGLLDDGALVLDGSALTIASPTSTETIVDSSKRLRGTDRSVWDWWYQVDSGGRFLVAGVMRDTHGQYSSEIWSGLRGGAIRKVAGRETLIETGTGERRSMCAVLYTALGEHGRVVFVCTLEGSPGKFSQSLAICELTMGE